jgi:uncharacterized protein
MKRFRDVTVWIAFPVAALLMAGCATPRAGQGAAASSTNFLYDGLMHFYQGPLNHLSAVRRGSCPMFPSDSAYSRQAVAKHGFAAGWVMSMDRLLRCGRDETKQVPLIPVHGQWKYYDPLEANDYWWHSGADDQAP